MKTRQKKMLAVWRLAQHMASHAAEWGKAMALPEPHTYEC